MEDEHGEGGIQFRDVVVGFVLTTVAFMGLAVWLFGGTNEKKPDEAKETEE